MNFDFACNIGHIQLDVPHQVWEAVVAGGNVDPLISRFLHSTPSFYANNLLRCYLSYFSPDFLTQAFTLVGLILFGLGLWHLVINNHWKLLALVLLAPLSPLFNIPQSGLYQGAILYFTLVLVILFGIYNLFVWLVKIKSSWW
ncbi:MAG: hypothetical protein M1484_00490 [Patescibacteria group bacterium]|nr:hypothetical protein [Patescibacteria group bacterium]MCL5431558.1 hypothetical protein [Patescibacteria group bacterium]